MDPVGVDRDSRQPFLRGELCLLLPDNPVPGRIAVQGRGGVDFSAAECDLSHVVMVLFSAIIASLSIYYISSDLDFLHSQPTSKDSIVRVRFVQTLINASWVVLIFAFPIFLAYGYYFNVNLGYYFYLLASLPPFVVIPTLLGITGIMVLMKLFPTEKAYQILSFLGLFFLAWMIIFFRFLSPKKFFR